MAQTKKRHGSGEHTLVEFNDNSDVVEVIKIPATLTIEPGAGASVLVQVLTVSNSDLQTAIETGQTAIDELPWEDEQDGAVTAIASYSIETPVTAVRFVATGGTAKARLVY